MDSKKKMPKAVTAWMCRGGSLLVWSTAFLTRDDARSAYPMLTPIKVRIVPVRPRRKGAR